LVEELPRVKISKVVINILVRRLKMENKIAKMRLEIKKVFLSTDVKMSLARVIKLVCYFVRIIKLSDII